MRSFTGKFCYDLLKGGRRHLKTGHHTASIVAHDGQTEQLGSLLAMTVGSYHLKNSLWSLKPGIKIQKDFHGLSTYCFRLETSSSTIPMGRSARRKSVIRPAKQVSSVDTGLLS